MPQPAPTGAQPQGRRSPGVPGASKSSKRASASDTDVPKEIRTSEQTEDFMMNVYKLKLCPRSSSHDWRTCPYAHQGENAARRDHQVTQYLSVCCPESKAKRVCPRGTECPFAHSMTEYFLHPSRYRTQLCNDGGKCTRPICFFAHSSAELRTPAYPSLNATQLEALFSARASLAREDEIQLEATLRACVIGPLPPLPPGAPGAPDAAGGSSGGSCAASAAGTPRAAALQAAAGLCAFDAAIAAPGGGGFGGGAPCGDASLLGLYPGLGCGGFGMGGASPLGCEGGMSPTWAQLSAAAAAAAPGPGAGLFGPAPAASRFAPPGAWLGASPAAAPAAASAPNQGLARILHMQKLREQLRALEEEQIASLLQQQQQAEAMAQLQLLAGDDGSGCGGGGFPDVPPGLQSLLAQQAPSVPAAGLGGFCGGGAGGGLGGGVFGCGGLGGVADGSGGGGGLRLLQGGWGGAALQPDILSGTPEPRHSPPLRGGTWHAAVGAPGAPASRSSAPGDGSERGGGSGCGTGLWSFPSSSGLVSMSGMTSFLSSSAGSSGGGQGPIGSARCSDPGSTLSIGMHLHHPTGAGAGAGAGAAASAAAAPRRLPSPAGSDASNHTSPDAGTGAGGYQGPSGAGERGLGFGASLGFVGSPFKPSPHSILDDGGLSCAIAAADSSLCMLLIGDS